MSVQNGGILREKKNIEHDISARKINYYKSKDK